MGAAYASRTCLSHSCHTLASPGLLSPLSHPYPAGLWGVSTRRSGRWWSGPPTTGEPHARKYCSTISNTGKALGPRQVGAGLGHVPRVSPPLCPTTLPPMRRSSMLQDISAGRPTEAEMLTGYISRLAAQRPGSVSGAFESGVGGRWRCSRPLTCSQGFLHLTFPCRFLSFLLPAPGGCTCHHYAPQAHQGARGPDTSGTEGASVIVTWSY